MGVFLHPAPFALNQLYLGLLFACLVVIEFLGGGSSLLFSLPSYGILSLLGLLSVSSFRRPQVPANLYCLLGTAVFFGYILARILTSEVEYLTRHDLFSVLAALIVYLVMALYLTSPKQRLWLLLGLLMLGLLNIGLGTVQYFRREHFALFRFVQAGEYGPRATGLYVCPDHLAGFLEVVGLMGLSAACWGRWPHWLKVSTGYVSLVCLFGVFLTGSRGGYLSAAGGFLVFGALSLKTLQTGMNVRKWLVIGCTVLALGMLAAGMTYFMSGQLTLKSRWVNLREKGGDRLSMWESAVKEFKLNPVLGTGSGSYLYYQRQFRKSSEWADAIYVHNDYLHLLAEYGLIGFAGFLLFFGAHVLNGLKSFRWFIGERLNSLGRIRSDTLALNIGALSALSTYVIHSMFDFNLHIPANALLMAIVFGFLANPGVETPFRSDHYERTSRSWRLALPALAIWLAWAGLPTLPAEYFAKQARAAATHEDFTGSLKAASRGIYYDKKNPYLYLYSGEALFGIGEAAATPVAAEMAFRTAARAYTNGLALFRRDRYLLLGMGWSLDGLKRFDEAEPYFLEVMALEPNSAQIRAYYAVHLHAAGKWDEAEAEYKKSNALYGNWASNLGLERLAKDRKAAAAAQPPK